MKKDFLKKSLVFEVVGLLVILSIVPVFSSGFNMGTVKLTDEKTAEETCLTEGFKEHKNWEYQFREEKHDKIHDVENPDNNRLCHWENTIGYNVKDTLNRYNSVDPSSCLMKTNNDNDETDYMGYYKSICTLPENSIVCGYVNNAENSAPIKNAYVDLLGRDSEGHYYHNDTYSDSSGFYSINVAAGDFKLDFEADRYYSNSSEDYNIGEYETLWVNMSLWPYPPENSVVCGYVTDASTGDPIEDAYVGLNWWDDQGHHDWNSTHTDSSGYYSMNVVAGKIDLYVGADGYYSKYTEDYAIGEDEILWVDFLIYPHLPENSVVCGYVTDETTGDPIGDNRVGLSWSDELGNRDSNGTYTDSSGYYSMNVEAGHVRLYVYVEGKNPEQYVDIDEYELLWVNFSIFCIPPKNSTVRGYVTDGQTGNPIKYAYVDLDWEDNQGHYYGDYTYTDSSGYYSMSVAAGVIDLYVRADGYFKEYTDNYNIDEHETLQIDVSLYPKPPENSVVHGYVTNEQTGDPIDGAHVGLDWEDNQGHHYGNYTYTNSSGFYSMNVAAGKIDLHAIADGYFIEYTGDYDIGENETLQIDISLVPKPPENSVVHGYVTNEQTGDPLEDAYVGLSWMDNQGHYYGNYTYTDSSGYYSINVAAGVIDLYVEADGYFRKYTDDYDIGEYETLQIDISLVPIPPENSVVHGYVTNEQTGDPLEDAYVRLSWIDNQGHYYGNYTYADSSGYYSMNVAAGRINMYARADGYFRKYTDDYDIGENETLWINFSMLSEPLWVSIVTPQKSLYINNNEVIPLFIATLIIGDVDINVGASDCTSFVKFYIDGKIMATDYSEPYTWTWSTEMLLKHRHTIKVVGYDSEGNYDSDEIKVWKFF